MRGWFGGSGQESKDLRQEDRAARVLISVLDGSFQKQVQDITTASSAGWLESAKLTAKWGVKKIGLTKQTEIVEYLRKLPDDPEKSGVNANVNVLDMVGRYLTDEQKQEFEGEMNLLTAVLKIQKYAVVGHSKMSKSQLENANDVYSAKLREICAVLIEKKSAIQDVKLLEEVGFGDLNPVQKTDEVVAESVVQQEPIIEEHKEGFDIVALIAEATEEMKKNAEKDEVVLPKQEDLKLVTRAEMQKSNPIQVLDRLATAINKKDPRAVKAALDNVVAIGPERLAGAIESMANGFNGDGKIKEALLNMKDAVKLMQQTKQEQEENRKLSNAEKIDQERLNQANQTGKGSNSL